VTERFDATRGPVVVLAEIQGPKMKIVARLALDTGATFTFLNAHLLDAIGCAPTAKSDRMKITTASAIEVAPIVLVRSLKALGQMRRPFRVIAHTLPPSASVDGLLGLDFPARPSTHRRL
jgi:hypothetical protein